MRNILSIISAMAILTACSGSDSKYDASGVFEVTEVMVSARVAGEIMELDIDEGTEVTAGKPVGYIDTVQLYLQRLQLEANVKAAESRICDVDKQTAAIRQQIATQKKEQTRFENLVNANAGNRKQLDDITAAINLLEKQLDAQTETLRNGNANAKAQAEALKAQIALTNDMISKSTIASPVGQICRERRACSAGTHPVQGGKYQRYVSESLYHIRTDNRSEDWSGSKGVCR